MRKFINERTLLCTMFFIPFWNLLQGWFKRWSIDDATTLAVHRQIGLAASPTSIEVLTVAQC